MSDTPQTHATFEGGAKRSSTRPRFDLIPREALEGLARRLEYGAARYGEKNWQKGAGDPAFIRDTTNHLMQHLLDFQLNGNTFDDNTGAMLANAAFLEYFQQHAGFAVDASPALVTPEGAVLTRLETHAPEVKLVEIAKDFVVVVVDGVTHQLHIAHKKAFIPRKRAAKKAGKRA